MRIFSMISALAIGLQTSICACSSGEDRVFESGSAEQKPTSSQMVTKSGLDSNQAKLVGTFHYLVTIATRSGISFKGRVHIDLMSDFSLVASEAYVQLGSQRLDISALISRLSTSILNKESTGNISQKDGILYIRELGGVEFEPPRPFLLGPIIRNPDRYKGLRQTTTHSVTGKAGDAPVSGSGKFTIEVLETKGTFTPSSTTSIKPFTNILHWQMLSSGFENISAINGFLYKKVEWWYSTSPIMIPKISILGSFGDLVSKGKKSASQDLVGDMAISIEVMDYQL